MYYVMPIDEREKPRFDAYVQGILFDEYDELAINLFINGETAKERASRSYKVKTNFEFSESGIVRDRLVTKVHNSPILIVSAVFKNLLLKWAPDCAEFYPVEFDKVNNSSLQDYYICNIIKKLDCTDYEKSILDFEFFNSNNEGFGRIYTVDSLVLNELKIPENADVFLLDNISRPILVFSESFKNEIEKRKISGFKFVAPQEFMI